jgi:pre-mRNA-splicing factor CWC22
VCRRNEFHKIYNCETFFPLLFADVFRIDPDFIENEKKYEVIKKEILGDESDEEGVEDGENASDEDESEEEEEDEEAMEERMQIQDETETNLVNLRRTIYLTIMSSVDFEEAGHKLLKIKLEPGQEVCSHFFSDVNEGLSFQGCKGTFL